MASVRANSSSLSAGTIHIHFELPRPQLRCQCTELKSKDTRGDLETGIMLFIAVLL